MIVQIRLEKIVWLRVAHLTLSLNLKDSLRPPEIRVKKQIMHAKKLF